MIDLFCGHVFFTPNIMYVASYKGLRVGNIICCVSCSDFVCSLAFEICLCTDTPEDAGNTFQQWFKTTTHNAVGTWSKVERGVLDACSCIRYDCGCCAHLEEKQIELNSTSKIVVVTEPLLLCIKVLCDVWCDYFCCCCS
jgi:hypothetical protein